MAYQSREHPEYANSSIQKDIIAHLELTFIRCVSIPRESRSKYRIVVVRSDM